MKKIYIWAAKNKPPVKPQALPGLFISSAHSKTINNVEGQRLNF